MTVLSQLVADTLEALLPLTRKQQIRQVRLLPDPVRREVVRALGLTWDEVRG